MRITQILLSKQLGGAERHVAGLCGALAARHEVQIILRPAAEGTASHLGSIAALLPPGIEQAEAGGFLRNRRIAAALAAFKPDVIHSHLGDAGKALTAIRPAAPCVATLHGQYKEKCYRKHDALICVADWQKSTIPESFGGLIETIPNFIAPRRPTPEPQLAALRKELGLEPGRPVVGAVGRLSPEKGYDLLIRAFLESAPSEALLVIVGEGPERARLEALAEGRAVFAGWREDPAPFYELFDLCAVPSRYEAFGISLLEAMQAGCPVVAARAQGPSDLLAAGAGRLVPLEDHRALGSAILELLADEDARRTLAEAGRAKAADYTIEAVVPRIEAMYRRLLRD